MSLLKSEFTLKIIYICISIMASLNKIVVISVYTYKNMVCGQLVFNKTNMSDCLENNFLDNTKQYRQQINSNHLKPKQSVYTFGLFTELLFLLKTILNIMVFLLDIHLQINLFQLFDEIFDFFILLNTIYIYFLMLKKKS